MNRTDRAFLSNLRGDWRSPGASHPSRPVPVGAEAPIGFRPDPAGACGSCHVPVDMPSEQAHGDFPVRTAPEHKAPVGFRGSFRPKPSGPVWIAFEAEAPAGSPIWQFREVRRPLVPPGCSTKLAHLAEARGKPAASAWRRLRQPPSPSASHRPPKGAPFRLGCGVRRLAPKSFLPWPHTVGVMRIRVAQRGFAMWITRITGVT